MKIDEKKNVNINSESFFNRITNWLVIIGTGLFSLNFFLFMGYHLWKDVNENWIIDLVKQHFAATIGLPFAAIASLCLVMLLKFTTGPIEFEGLGFKFRGASGPIIFWVICFLAIAAAIKFCW